MEKNLKDCIYRIACLFSDIDSAYHQASVRLGISDSASFILYMLYANGYSCSLNDIYKISGISKQTVNSAMRKLEGEGVLYLEKLDGKAKRVCATDSGRAYIDRTGGQMFAAELKCFHAWSGDEIDRFILALEKYNALFKKQIEEMEHCD